MDRERAKEGTETKPVGFWEAFWFWVKLGFINFGGPAGQIAIMHRELVERKRWVSEGQYLRTLNFCMLLPGPEAQQVATYIGWRLHGTVGGIVAGSFFVIPSIFVLLLLSYMAVAHSDVPVISGLLYGVQPVVIAIVVEALLRIGRRTINHRVLVGFAVVVFGTAVWTRAWDQGKLGEAMGRSLVVTVLITIAQVVTSILAAYAFAFLRFPAKPLVFALFMGTLLLPLEVTLLANVQTIRELGWINGNAGLVAPFAATAFGTFLIRQGFKGVPPEIQDATRLDGYGHMAFLWRFAVPLTRPVIASFTVISALGAWNQYLWPQAVIDDSRYQTAQIRLKSIVGTEVANANVGVAAALIVALPVVLLLVAFQRQIIRGLTAGAVKG